MFTPHTEDSHDCGSYHAARRPGHTCPSRTQRPPERPCSVANYRCGESSLTAVETIAHMGDLMDWALSMAEGQQQWHHSTPLAWDKECERFFAALKSLDDYLASEKPLQVPAEKLSRGPIADALAHAGEIALLCHMLGALR